MKKFHQLFLISSLTFFLGGCTTLENLIPSKKTEEVSVQNLILQGRYDEAKNMFLTKTDINECDDNGNTALHTASQVGDTDLVTYLLLKNADSTLKNNEGQTALHIAILNGRYGAARVLAEHGGNLFLKNNEGKTPLDLTAEINSDDWYDALLTDKTTSQKNSSGQNVVHYYVLKKNLSAVNACIKRNAPLSLLDFNSQTPLLLAFSNPSDEKNIEIAAALIMAKCEPVRGNFSYFEDAVRTRNMSLRSDDNQTPLHLACVQGHKGIVKYLLSNGANIQAQDNTGATPLHEAVRYGQIEIVNLLLTEGAKVNARDSLGKTPLLLIIPKKSQEEIYASLLSKHADANAKDLYGDTPLHIATMDETSITILQELVDAGADINERNKAGLTPLSLAVEHNLSEHISFYAKLGADIHAEDKKHITPLTRAFDQKNIGLLKNLVTKDNISSRDSQGNTPLHLAITKKAPMEYTRYLLESGADIDARNSEGDSVLYLAVQSNSRQVGEILISRGANVYAANTSNFSPLRLAMTTGGEVQDWMLGSSVIGGDDGNGNTPLHYAAEWKLDSSIEYIIQKGGKVDKKNANGETALFNAVKSDSVSTINLLIKKKADTNSRDLLGNTPLHYAVRWNALNAAQALLENGCNINAKNSSGKTPLSDAGRSGAKAMVNLLLSKGADVNASDATGKTILTDAVQSDLCEIVEILLAKGASVNIQDMYGRNSYHEAATIGDVKIINLLRQYGANPMSRDSFGKTPFSLVIGKDSATIKAILGNDTKLTDSDGNSPLHAAINARASKDVIETLINMGYPLNLRNGQGLTVLSLALEQKQFDNARVILLHGADPFVTDNVGECAVLLSFKDENKEILADMVNACGTKTDLQGDYILHYAARNADASTVKKLLSLGLERSRKNTAGETPYDMALRWKRPEIAELLK